MMLLISGSIMAQKDTLAPDGNTSRKAVYECGMNVYGLTIRAGDYYSEYKNVWDNQVFSGLYLKRHVGKNALRASLEYSRRRALFGKEAWSATRANTGQLVSVDLQVGYQRSFGQGTCSPYVFADAAFAHYFPVAVNYTYPYLYSYSSFAPTYFYYRYYTLSGSFLSINPGLGLRWSLAKNVCLNIETCAQFFFSHERTPERSETFNSVGVNARPLRLSIGFKI